MFEGAKRKSYQPTSDARGMPSTTVVNTAQSEKRSKVNKNLCVNSAISAALWWIRFIGLRSPPSRRGHRVYAENIRDIKITGGVAQGDSTGTGKLLLRPNSKLIAGLSAKGTGTTGAKFALSFVADEKNQIIR